MEAKRGALASFPKLPTLNAEKHATFPSCIKANDDELLNCSNFQCHNLSGLLLSQQKNIRP